MAATESEDISRRIKARIEEVGAALGAHLSELTADLHAELAGQIEPLQGDQPLLDLLYASIESNLETLAHILSYEIPVAEVSTPSAAEEYARRLAQRGISSTALIRAYRLGQKLIVQWAFDELNRRESDARVALAAGRQITDLTFQYIDSISEQVVHAYESERERWLSNHNTVRVAMVEELIGGAQPDAGAAEQALGYRIRQHHLGVLLWSPDSHATRAVDLPQLERLLAEIAKAVGGQGQPLFLPRDRSTAWGWVPLGRAGEPPRLGDVEPVFDHADGRLCAAFGTPTPGAQGFRVTHLEAVRARQVALAAGDTAHRVTSYVDPEVRTAAMLATDLEAAKRMVAQALGALAEDTEAAERLRDTLLTFLTEKASYTATAERVHLHKNTVKYRVDKAIEERGRPLDDERLELELALVACRWLGASVLRAT